MMRFEPHTYHRGIQSIRNAFIIIINHKPTPLFMPIKTASSERLNTDSYRQSTDLRNINSSVQIANNTYSTLLPALISWHPSHGKFHSHPVHPTENKTKVKTKSTKYNQFTQQQQQQKE